jgi:hypothetical protein
MRLGSRYPSGQRMRVTWVTWSIASVLFLFTTENIWIDPWFKNKFQGLPSLVPEALSGTWFLAFAIIAISLVILISCQILLLRDRSIHVWTKAWTAIAVFFVLLLSMQWFNTTRGEGWELSPKASGSPHKVTLTWKASSSQVAGYNLYRSTISGGDYIKINSSLIHGITFTDNTVEGGRTYYYVTRAVDDRGNESINSNEITAAIP